MTDGQPLPPPAPPAPEQEGEHDPQQATEQRPAEQQRPEQQRPEQQRGERPSSAEQQRAPEQRQEATQQPAAEPAESGREAVPPPSMPKQDPQELVTTRETPSHGQADDEGRDDDREREPEGGSIVSKDGAISFRRRWEDIELVFVDEPRSSVRQADELVQNVVQEITEVFGRERRHLEGQWDRGDQVSTEDLRVALQRYREFFNRLLET